MKTVYRAVCFGKAVGPWRRGRALAEQDLVDAGLGEYSQLGGFYITVPGDLQVVITDQGRAARSA